MTSEKRSRAACILKLGTDLFSQSKCPIFQTVEISLRYKIQWIFSSPEVQIQGLKRSIFLSNLSSLDFFSRGKNLPDIRNARAWVSTVLPIQACHTSTRRAPKCVCDPIQNFLGWSTKAAFVNHLRKCLLYFPASLDLVSREERRGAAAGRLSLRTEEICVMNHSFHVRNTRDRYIFILYFGQCLLLQTDLTVRCVILFTAGRNLYRFVLIVS